MSSTQDKLDALFKLRDKQYTELTAVIANMLSPTVLEALYTVLRLPQSEVLIHDIYNVDDMVIIAVSALYADPEDVPPAINMLATYTNYMDDLSECRRMIKLILPPDMLFEDSATLVNYIEDRLNQQIEHEKQIADAGEFEFDYMVEQAITKSSNGEFDWSQLSEDQVKNIHQIKGKKH